MKGLITNTVAVLWGIGGLMAGAGCYGYRDLVDPCYPERYESVARQEVVEAFAPQVHNGHILDQTVWNHHFEFDEERRAGTDRLTVAGMEHLAYLARRRPCPDPAIYVQQAQDIPYDGAAPQKFVEARSHLDALRIAAVQKYLNAYTAGRNVDFTVCLHDPAEVGMSAVPARGSNVLLSGSAQGVMAGGGRGTATTSSSTVTATSSSGGGAGAPTAGGP